MEGFDEPFFEEVDDDFFGEDDEFEAARRAMEGKLRLLSRETDRRKKREKLFRFMASRGFSPAVIFKLADEMQNQF